MILFYNQSKKNSYLLLIKTKIISFNYNDKFYFRGQSLSNKFILDNENILLENKLILKDYLLGNTLSLSPTLLQHNFNSKLNFENFHFQNFFKKNYTIKLLKILNKNTSFLITTTIKKGGMSVFSNGLKGFLPRSNFYKMVQKILCLPKYNIQSLFFLLNKKNKLIEQNVIICFIHKFN